eukprot:931986_1
MSPAYQFDPPINYSTCLVLSEPHMNHWSRVNHCHNPSNSHTDKTRLMAMDETESHHWFSRLNITKKQEKVMCRFYVVDDINIQMQRTIGIT